ncbi:MAG: ubiquinol-cytochrome c reductase iron-sulfur subunit [Chloroflexi bacterium]|nr:ubiquinol-cytochrome c reductase iron-sulfur subunit [Chloroflexota bacterium]
MTTQTIAKGKAAVQTREASAPTAAASSEVAVKPINRREFLYYIWGASIAVFLAQTTGAIIWFALPRFREGEYGGIFVVDPATVPAVGASPVANPTGKYWLSHTPNGLVALNMVCTHLGCLFKWVEVNRRFECPCHGSKFGEDGRYIEGPAPRNLDRFAVRVTTPTGVIESDANGSPVKIDGAVRIEINTGKKIKGASIGQA